jgi:hypothetical protein
MNNRIFHKGANMPATVVSLGSDFKQITVTNEFDQRVCLLSNNEERCQRTIVSLQDVSGLSYKCATVALILYRKNETSAPEIKELKIKETLPEILAAFDKAGFEKPPIKKPPLIKQVREFLSGILLHFNKT